MTSNAVLPNLMREVVRIGFVASLLAVVPAKPSLAAVTFTTQHGVTIDAFNHLISSDDLIQGKNTLDVEVFENPFDSFGNPSVPGWHPVNTDPADQIAAFTDGQGMRPTNFTGLLNDNYPDEGRSGRPAKIVEYPFTTPVDIGRIQILTGNQNDPDGRIFSTTYIEYSIDGGFTYQGLGYFQSDPSGTINNRSLPLDQQHKTTLVSIFDDSSSTLLTGVTNIIFNLYSVDNTLGEMRDPFDGTNPFTGFDDGLTSPAVSPLVLELDVLAPMEGPGGDYNGDGKVDAADYVIWRKNDGSQPGFDAWRASFGETVSGMGAAGILAAPEPQALAILLAFLSFASTLRMRRTGDRGLLR